MSHHKSIVTLAVLVSLVFSTPALAAQSKLVKEGARHHHRDMPHPRRVARAEPIAAAIAIAERYWHAAPCSGQIRITVTMPPANDENGGIDASMWSSWNSTAGTNVETGTQPFTNCIIGINSAVWNTGEMMAYTAWPEFSIDLIHEFGHLLGHSHSTDPADVMYSEPSAKVQITGEYLWAL